MGVAIRFGEISPSDVGRCQAAFGPSETVFAMTVGTRKRTPIYFRIVIAHQRRDGRSGQAFPLEIKVLSAGFCRRQWLRADSRIEKEQE
jgi:hypothetical protein